VLASLSKSECGVDALFNAFPGCFVERTVEHRLKWRLRVGATIGIGGLVRPSTG